MTRTKNSFRNTLASSIVKMSNTSMTSELVKTITLEWNWVSDDMTMPDLITLL